MFLFSLNLMYKHNFIIVVYLLIICIIFDVLICMINVYYVSMPLRGPDLIKTWTWNLWHLCMWSIRLELFAKKNTWSFRFFVLLGTCGWEKNKHWFQSTKLIFKKKFKARSSSSRLSWLKRTNFWFLMEYDLVCRVNRAGSDSSITHALSMPSG